MRDYAIYARMGGGATLLVFWGLFDSPFLGVVLAMVLLLLSILRYQVAPYRVLPWLEAAVSVGFAVVWLPALLGLWLPVIGFVENKWTAREREWFEKDYDDRTARLRLEDQIDETARDSLNAARLAEITERARIAQDIHDHVGHEIHGALIAVQTAQKLYEKSDPRTAEMLTQSIRRLESAAATLRETVHNLKPAQTIGADTLADICAAFTFCPLQFIKSGDLSGMAHWRLLAANLKELLTNITRHSTATEVTVRLDGNKDYIRMTVTDNGKTNNRPIQPGLGISGMKERLRSLGGMLTVNTAQGFQVICIIPKTGD